MTKDKRVVLQNIQKGEDLEALFGVYQSNANYFGVETVELEAIQADMESMPEGLDINYKEYLKICVDDTIIGVVDLLESYPDMDTLTLKHMLIHKDYQGQGYGCAAYKEVEAYYGQRFLRLVLSVKEDQEKAIAFWEKQGLKIEGRSDCHHCGNPCSCVEMVKDFE